MRKQDFDRNDPKAFDVRIEDLVAHVSVHIIQSAKIFHLIYDNGREPLNMTIAVRDDGSKFWTSLPEGRQEEAELAGDAVTSYLREYRRSQECVTTIPKKSATPSLFD